MPKPSPAKPKTIPWADLVKVYKGDGETIFSIDSSNIAHRPELVPPALRQPVILQDSELVVPAEFADYFPLHRRPEEITNSSTPIWNAFIAKLKQELDPAVVAFLEASDLEDLSAYNLIATSQPLRNLMTTAPILLQAAIEAMDKLFMTASQLSELAELPPSEFSAALRDRFHSAETRKSESPASRQAKSLRITAWLESAPVTAEIWSFSQFDKLASFIEDQNLDRVRNFPPDFFELLYRAIDEDLRLAKFFINGPMTMKSALLRNMPNVFIDEIDTDEPPEVLTLHRLAVYLQHCDEAKLPVPNGVKPLGSRARKYFVELENEESEHTHNALSMLPRVSGMTFPSAVFTTKPSFEFEGETFTLRPLLSADALLREGRENINCIKEPKFALRCSTGYRYFFSVMPETKTELRASLETNAAGSIIGIEFKNNKPVPAEFRAAVNEFLRENWTARFTPAVFAEPATQQNDSLDFFAL